ncbi:MAG: hypothetical protein ABEI86_09050 [Halobacteriaceae archaeon]
MSKVDSLIDEWGSDNVQKAFMLQGEIKRHGLSGIHFMEGGEKAMESAKEEVIKANLRMHMENQY